MGTLLRMQFNDESKKRLGHMEGHKHRSGIWKYAFSSTPVGQDQIQFTDFFVCTVLLSGSQKQLNSINNVLRLAGIGHTAHTYSQSG